MILNLLFSDPALFLVWLVAIVTAITVHEFSHAAAASLQGDGTAQSLGRLTFNPLAHIDPLGFLALLFVGFGWGRPVPFNPWNLRNSRFGPAVVGLAGPLANIVMVVVFGFLLKATIGLGIENRLFLLFAALVQINLVLFLFNLLPIRYTLERYGPFILLAVILFGSRPLGAAFSYLFSAVLDAFIGTT